MHKATKDPEALAKQIADSKYSHKKTLFVDVLLALLAGFFLAQAVPLRDYFIPEEELATQDKALTTQDEKLALLTDLVEHLDMLVAHPANMKRWPELGPVNTNCKNVYIGLQLTHEDFQRTIRAHCG
ncbi:hypothetical protein KL86DPRO_30134 [uncultured delta proteobacterium]|uniref:Uncharacterized protein n=1 Tax=uncultured delta proteobacterium TaxID=34034 RepID=A0A212K8P2_9DELT|nr:hypothetical protein KL86DPRO_30134 [uncultured delta proteobacterium]